MSKEEHTDNGIFERMVDESIKKVSSEGKASDVKDIVLVAFGMATRNMSEKLDTLGSNIIGKLDSLRKPMYFVGVGLLSIGLGWIVDTIVNRVVH
jgi:hypothetical protein